MPPDTTDADRATAAQACRTMAYRKASARRTEKPHDARVKAELATESA